MKIKWIALVTAITLSYFGTAMQFFPTHAVPKWLTEFFAGDHDHGNNSDKFHT
jgi:hypothetical protein